MCCMRRKLGTLVPLEIEILTIAVSRAATEQPDFHGFELAKLIAEHERSGKLARPRNALQSITPSGECNVDVRLAGCRHRARRWATTSTVVSDHRSRRAGCRLGGDLRHAARVLVGRGLEPT